LTREEEIAWKWSDAWGNDAKSTEGSRRGVVHGKRYQTEIVARQIRFLGQSGDATAQPASSDAPF
jgi:hypothetical protein